jgi:hypothetical protein
MLRRIRCPAYLILVHLFILLILHEVQSIMQCSLVSHHLNDASF